MSTESIASTTPPVGAPETCRRCGSPLAEDQRYCLECGERRTPASSVLLGGPPSPASAAPPASAPPAPPLPGGSRNGSGDRSNAVTVIAGVGVLLLAMGVGVLIGRSGASKSSGSVAPQVITVAAPGGSTGATGTSSTEASTFSDDWPAGKSGYTVQLQTLTQASSTTSEVQAAKSAASAKGAKGVGALKSEDFSSLTAGNYVIYSGEYSKQAEANKALSGLKKDFPKASVVKVSNGGASSSSSNSAPSAKSPSSSGAGSSESHPAPPKVLEEEHKSKGKSFEEKSKNLPDVVGT
ncbi:MAG TPA: hypothetical protein VK761_02700 [Solirubrobacteraceae bacterium]|nr:hypothetical protein [Solirubrobacteraceae bacterium]